MREPWMAALAAVLTVAGCGARDGEAEVQRAMRDIASVEDALEWDRWARNEARGTDVAVSR